MPSVRAEFLVDKCGNDVNVDDTLILYESTAMPYAIYEKVKPWSSSKKKDEEKQEVVEYSRLVGANCAKRILLFRE